MSLHSLAYDVYTIYLFTCDTIIPVIIPWALAGIADAVSPNLTATKTQSPAASLQGASNALLWMYLNILVFTINNQSSPNSIAEDKINKPWRAIAAGRMTRADANNLLLILIPAVWILTSYLGAGTETLLAFALGWMYNDLDGSSSHYAVRNGINALSIVVASVASTKLTLGGNSANNLFTDKGYQWLTLKALVICTSLQMQDLRDQEGDQKRGRSTVPLVFGDEVARWSIVFTVTLWSFFCPWFLNTTFFGYILPVLLGGVVNVRVLSWKSVEADKLSWKLWGIWSFAIFCLPFWTVDLKALG